MPQLNLDLSARTAAIAKLAGRRVVASVSGGRDSAAMSLYIGYRKLITYTLPDEGGASLRGAGWKLIGEAGGGSWHRESRPRVDTHPTQEKLRWERTKE